MSHLQSVCPTCSVKSLLGIPTPTYRENCRLCGGAGKVEYPQRNFVTCPECTPNYCANCRALEEEEWESIKNNPLKTIPVSDAFDVQDWKQNPLEEV